MTPNPPTPTTTLRDNGNIELDLEAVFEDPKAAAKRWLEQYAERRKQLELKEMTPDQLYDKLDGLKVKKSRLPRSRDQYTQHTRQVYKAEMAQVRAELKRRELPIRKPTDKRVLATAAHIAVKKAAA